MEKKVVFFNILRRQNCFFVFFFKRKYNAAEKTIREIPHFHIYDFLKAAAPSDFGSIGVWNHSGESQKKEEKALFVHGNLLRVTQAAKGRKKEKKKQNPQTFMFRLETMDEDLEVFQLNLCLFLTFELH